MSTNGEYDDRGLKVFIFFTASMAMSSCLFPMKKHNLFHGELRRLRCVLFIQGRLVGALKEFDG